MWLAVFLFRIVALTLVTGALHELGHTSAALAVGCKVKKVGLSFKGLYTVRTPAASKVRNRFVTAGGFLFNLLVAIALWGCWHELAIYNLVLAFFTMVPLPRSDMRRLFAY